MKEIPGAIVIGGHFQGLGVIRALAAKGIPVVLLDSEPCLSRFSRCITRFIKSPSILDGEDYLSFLMNIADEKGCTGYCIFPTDDETVRLLSFNHDLLTTVYRLMTPSWNTIKFTYNKKYTYQQADSLNIPTPRTFYPRNEADLSQFEIPYPALIKPAVMRDFFRQTGKKVFRALNEKELLENYRKASRFIPPEEILIQEEIPEVSRNLFSYCPFFKDGKSISSITAARPRQHPMDFGQASTFAVTTSIPDIETQSQKFLKSINYYGLAEVEFIRDPRDGVYKLLEVNARIWGWHSLATAAGVNLPYLVYRDLNGLPFSPNGYKTGIKWIRLLTDTAVVLSEMKKGRLNLVEYFKSIRGKKTFAVFSLQDPLPFWGELMLLPHLRRERGFS